MNVVPGYETEWSSATVRDASQQDESDLRRFIAAVRRHFPFILACVAVCLLGALAYLYAATPWYTATTEVLMETRRNVTQRLDASPDVPIDAASVESQVETIKSERVARAVIKNLKLDEDPEFIEHRTLLQRITQPFRPSQGAAQMSPEERFRRAMLRLGDRLSAKRVAMSYVIQISFTALDPQKAAAVANAVSDAYITDQLESKYEASQRAETWLQERLAELRDKASQAEKLVLDYKQANNIITTDNRLVEEQQIADVSQRLTEVRARLAESRARLDRITEVLSSGQVNGAVADVMTNSVITSLRQRYLEASARVAEWTKRYGPQHRAVIDLRNEVEEVQRSMLDEVKRIQQTYRSDYEILKARELEAQKSLDERFQKSGGTKLSQVKLRELEGVAQNARALYDNFVQRQMQVAQQQSFPFTDARVLTVAARPDRPSFPKPPIVLALGLAAGLGVGVGSALLRELLDRTARTKRQLEQASGVPCLGILPRIKKRVSKTSLDQKQIAERGKRREITPMRSELTYVARAPFSQFAEGVRAIKLAADLTAAGSGATVIGISSCLPEEGKSTLSANLGFLIAQTGSRVLLIDCDLRNPSLTRGLAPLASDGLPQVLANQLPAEGLIWQHPRSGLHFLPASLKETPHNHSGLLSSEAMRGVIQIAKSHYDYVILDFAPMLPVVDVRAAAHLVDAFVLVAEWSKTPLAAVTEAVAMSSAVRSRLLGTILNKVDVRVMRRNGEYDGTYHSQYFER